MSKFSNIGKIIDKAKHAKHASTYLIQYYMNPLSSYNLLSSKDKEDFALLLDAWRPQNDNRYLLRWLLTTWCNYRCPYCNQNHKKSSKTHAFDNHNASMWLSAFDKHFQNFKLSIVITGGEPLIDTKNMPYLLKGLTEREYIDNIRIDTNASWNPLKYKEINPTKIWLMCTFHPSQVEEKRFIEKIKTLLDYGYKIGMINYVIYGKQIEKFEEKLITFANMGIPLHPNPLWDSHGKIAQEELSILKKSFRLPFL